MPATADTLLKLEKQTTVTYVSAGTPATEESPPTTGMPATGARISEEERMTTNSIDRTGKRVTGTFTTEEKSSRQEN
jgi:hypothetical protein